MTTELWGATRSRRAFTLIELLIVVAIIAILAAIAVPNFLEAQTRAKVTRVRNDLRTLATALESYRVDNNDYPTDNDPRPAPGDPTTANLTLGFELTTPISYISTMEIMNDIFKLERAELKNNPTLDGRQRYGFTSVELQYKQGVMLPATYDILIRRVGAWRLYGAGPDRYVFFTGQTPEVDYADFATIDYDPTNGTISFGDIFRSQRSPEKGLP